MSALSNHLQALFDFLTKGGHSPPSRKVRIVEIGQGAATDDRGRLRVPSAKLQKPADYEPRFDELMQAGLPWINISCYGVHDGELIIGVEIPEEGGQQRAAIRTSVNYSGPVAAVLQRGWDADGALAIEQ